MKMKMLALISLIIIVSLVTSCEEEETIINEPNIEKLEQKKTVAEELDGYEFELFEIQIGSWNPKNNWTEGLVRRTNKKVKELRSAGYEVKTKFMLRKGKVKQCLVFYRKNKVD